MKVIVIGGNAAGMSAAAKLRRLDEKTIIYVYEKGTDISYSGCGMPYYLGHVIRDEEKLIARTQKEFKKQNIDVFLNHEVIKINPDKKEVIIKDLKNDHIITDTYDKLLISTGTLPKRTNIEGSDDVKIYVLNQLKDMRHLDAVLDKAKTVAIIGGGYIGVEIAENLVRLKKEVHIIERENQLLLAYDKEVAKKAEAELIKHGVHVHLNENLEKYKKVKNQTYVKTDKNELKIDIIIEAIGVGPNTKFLEDTNIKMIKGAIITNNQMETNIKDIYAAGDCVMYYHQIKEDLAYVPLGTHANKTGKMVALNMMGIKTNFPGIVGSNILKVGDLAFAKTGVGIDEAKKLKLDYDYVDVKAKHQTGYYPGAKELFIRLVYEKSTKILKGAQLVGEKGVGDRINIMALAITKQLTAEAFSELDFAYAPPFSPVWDPLLIAASQIK